MKYAVYVCVTLVVCFTAWSGGGLGEVNIPATSTTRHSGNTSRLLSRNVSEFKDISKDGRNEERFGNWTLKFEGIGSHLEVGNISRLFKNYPDFDADTYRWPGNGMFNVPAMQVVDDNTNQTFENISKSLGTLENDTLGVHNEIHASGSNFKLLERLNVQTKKIDILFQNDKIMHGNILKTHNINENLTDYLSGYLLNMSYFDRNFKQLVIKNHVDIKQEFRELSDLLKQTIQLFRQFYDGAKESTERDDQEKESHSLHESPSSHQGSGLPEEMDYKVTMSKCNGQRRHLLNRSCYYVPKVSSENQLYSWWDSRYHCKQVLGTKADLVVFNNERELKAVTQMLKIHFGDIEEFWLGASTLNSENKRWKWVDGSLLDLDSFISWMSSISLQNEVSCMSMYGGYQLNAEPCFYMRHPVCEIKLPN